MDALRTSGDEVKNTAVRRTFNFMYFICNVGVDIFSVSQVSHDHESLAVFVLLHLRECPASELVMHTL